MPLADGQPRPDNVEDEAELDNEVLEALDGGTEGVPDDDSVVLLDELSEDDTVLLDELVEEDDLKLDGMIEESALVLDELGEEDVLALDEPEEETSLASLRPAFVEPSYTNWPSDDFG